MAEKTSEAKAWDRRISNKTKKRDGIASRLKEINAAINKFVKLEKSGAKLTDVQYQRWTDLVAKRKKFGSQLDDLNKDIPAIKAGRREQAGESFTTGGPAQDYDPFELDNPIGPIAESEVSSQSDTDVINNWRYRIENEINRNMADRQLLGLQGLAGSREESRGDYGNASGAISRAVGDAQGMYDDTMARIMGGFAPPRSANSNYGPQPAGPSAGPQPGQSQPVSIPGVTMPLNRTAGPELPSNYYDQSGWPQQAPLQKAYLPGSENISADTSGWPQPSQPQPGPELPLNRTEQDYSISGNIPVGQQLDQMVQDRLPYMGRTPSPEQVSQNGTQTSQTGESGQDGQFNPGLYQQGLGYFDQGAGEIAAALQGMGGLYGTAANAVGTGLDQARGQYGQALNETSDWGRAVGDLYTGARGDLERSLAGELGQYDQGMGDINNWEQGLNQYYDQSQNYLSGGLNEARNRIAGGRADIEGGLGRVRDQYGLAQGDVDNFGQQALGRLEEGRRNRRASSEADLMSRGLGASTIVGAMGQGIDREYDDQVLGVEEAKSRQRTGLRERLAGTEFAGGQSLADLNRYGAGIESDFSGRQSDLASRRGDQSGQVAGARLGLRSAAGGAMARTGAGLAGLREGQAGQLGDIARTRTGLRENLSGMEMSGGRSLADIYSGLGNATAQAGRDVAGMRQGQGALTNSYAGLLGQLGTERARARQQGGTDQSNVLRDRAGMEQTYGRDMSQLFMLNRPTNAATLMQPYVEPEEGSSWGRIAGALAGGFGGAIGGPIGRGIGSSIGGLFGGGRAGGGGGGGGGYMDLNPGRSPAEVANLLRIYGYQ